MTENRVKETGFPSPAQGYEARTFDFNQLLVQHPAATVVMEATSSDMAYRGVFPGSLFIIDRSVLPRSGSLVIITYNGNFLCREMIIKDNLVSFTNGVNELSLSDEEITVFGTITRVITKT
jgi:DNA polymerase V